MFFNYKFWYFLTRPQYLADNLQTGTMRNYHLRIWIIFISASLLFALRSIWGMQTETITPLIVTMSTIDFNLARMAHLVGSIGWALLYTSFHYWGIAYIISAFTKIPFRKLLPLQCLMVGILLLEKTLIFFVFAMKGVTTNVSFLSFGPLAAVLVDSQFSIFLLNQLTIATALIIALQYSFIRRIAPELDPKKVIGYLNKYSYFTGIMYGCDGLSSV